MKKEYLKYYIYLEMLRIAGITNMFGAVPYLRHKFDLSEEDAKEILNNWMKHYNEIKKEFYESEK